MIDSVLTELHFASKKTIKNKFPSVLQIEGQAVISKTTDSG